MERLFEYLKDAAVSQLQPQRRVDLPSLCNEIDLPYASDNQRNSKREYILSRIEHLRDDPVKTRQVAEKFVEHYPLWKGYEETFTIEEMLWTDSGYPTISKRLRREIAESIEEEKLFVDSDGFRDAMGRLWVLQSEMEKNYEVVDEVVGEMFGKIPFRQNSSSNSLKQQIEKHVIGNSGRWSTEDFFKRLSAFDCSDKRFGKFIEALAGPDVRPDESSQRSFAEIVNSVLSPQGLELAETGEADGYPTFTLQAIGTGAVGKPKNLIFASPVKPDLRFRDAVNNDIEIVTHADKVLVYENPIPDTGLRWRDLQAWWKEHNQCRNDKEAKTTLYRRLLESLPQESPPQKLLFDTFFRHFGQDVPNIPALLPEVWLHYDPKPIEQRGRSALFRQRMDFLLLISPGTRVVIEVDGSHHYSDKTGRADTKAYAKMVSADRDLRLCGYDVYRFGGSELQGEEGARLVRRFFDDLFTKHKIRM